MTVSSFLYISEEANLHIGTFEPGKASAQSAGFPDVNERYWAYEEITWADESGLMTGYKDGSFGPGDEMTEAQFVTILQRYFNLETSGGENSHWSQPSYQALSHSSLRMPGLRNDSVKNREVTRGIISQALAHSQGQEPGLEKSVAWMFEEDLTTGRQDGSTQTERYDVNGKLTRAQAAVFFKRLHDSQFTKWQAEMLLDLTPEGSNGYTEKVRSLYNEAGVTLYARDNSSFATADPEYYHLFQAYQGERREYVIARTTEANFELASKAAEALGAPLSADEIFNALKQADQTEEVQQLGEIEINPRPSDIFMLWDEQEE
ncbi:S-layer homology domain-containing protein [Alteribacillus sp. YIM 98480]|uniref:S-layer homology domain-containing protein n=1 Tax=Alteribacillus sp. YIM 98480 TaxID=2606599 RepID=UPI00131BFB65|nr:S-layer homology domain-containing protein [Alteribacillus sp. YIM 98480]